VSVGIIGDLPATHRQRIGPLERRQFPVDRAIARAGLLARGDVDVDACGVEGLCSRGAEVLAEMRHRVPRPLDGAPAVDFVFGQQIVEELTDAHAVALQDDRLAGDDGAHALA
jgi:hypothetical protein